MVCKEIKRYLGRYLDGELAEDERLRVEAHLAECEGCREALAELQAVDDTGRTYSVQDPGEAYWRRMRRDVRGRIRDVDRKASPLILKLKPVLWPERIGYRLVGLTATAVFVLLLARVTFFEGRFFQFRQRVPGHEEMEQSAVSPLEEVTKDKEEKPAVSRSVEDIADKEGGAPVPSQEELGVLKVPESRQAEPAPALASRENTYTETAAQRTRAMKRVQSSAGVDEAGIPQAYQEEALSDRIERTMGSGGTAFSIAAGGRTMEDLENNIAQSEAALQATEDTEARGFLIEELAGLYFERAILTEDPTLISGALRFYQDHEDVFQGRVSATIRIDSLRSLLEEIEKK